VFVLSVRRSSGDGLNEGVKAMLVGELVLCCSNAAQTQVERTLVATVGRGGGAVVVVHVGWGAEWWIARVSCVEGGRRKDSANRVKNCGGLQLFVIMLDRRTVCAG
jgi:hypothetical protein